MKRKCKTCKEVKKPQFTLITPHMSGDDKKYFCKRDCFFEYLKNKFKLIKF